MTTKFFATNNVRWFAQATAPNGKPGSERMTLYGLIAATPGITSDQLQEQWRFPTSMRSRLKELYDARYLRTERISDLFIGEA